MSNGFVQDLPNDEIATLRGRIAELEAELEARKAEPYARFFEHSLALLCVADSNGYFQRLNSAWEPTLGWSLEELRARPFVEFVHPEDREATLDAVRKLEGGKPAIAFENRYCCKNGSYRWLRWFTAPVDDRGMMYAVAQDITGQRAAEERARVYEDTIRNSSTGMVVWHLERPDDSASLRLVMANEAASKYVGIDLVPEIGRLFDDVIPRGREAGLPQMYANIARSGGIHDIGEIPYGDDRIEHGVFLARAFALPDYRVCITFENITERKQGEEALRQTIRQEEIIRAQAASLAELSTPLIPISDDIVVMPLIGTLDSQRAQQVIETLLAGITSSRAKTAILDITGVAMVDTQVADALIRAARAVKLLGASVILTGIRPEVARTLVELSVDLGGIKTHSSLRAGIAAVFRS